MAQFGSALGSGLRGRRFKSCRPDHFIYRYLSREYSKRYISLGELSEWLKEHDWKSCIGRTLYRGFKSHALRHKKKDDHEGDRLFLSFIKSVFSANIFFTRMDTVAHAVLPRHALCGFLSTHGVSDSIMPEDGESVSF